MAYVVAFFGVLVFAVGVAGAVFPDRLMTLLMRLRGPRLLWAAVAIRALGGVVLILAAPTTRMPTLIRIVGIIALVAAAVLPLIGEKRMSALIEWWHRQSPWLLRVGCVVAIAFGALLYYASGV